MRAAGVGRCRAERRALVALLTAAFALAAACSRDRSASGPFGPLAIDRVMGRYTEREGPAGRTVTFDGAGGTTYTDRVGAGRGFTARGRYWMAGDTVRADYEFGKHGGRFAFWAVRRGDALIVVGPLLGTGPLPEFPPLVRDPPDE